MNQMIKVVGIFFIIILGFMSVLAYSDTNTYVSLNGSSSVSVPDADNLDGFSQATWNIWVKQDNYVDKAGIIGKYYPKTNGRSYLIKTALGSSISLVFSPDGSTTESQTSTSKFQCGIRNNNEWTMITITYDGSTIYYYRNGIRCSVDSTNVDHIFNSDQPLTFGSGNKVFFQGSIDDAKLYGKSLERQQVIRLYDESMHGKNLGQSVTTLLYHKIDDDASSSDKVSSQNFLEQMQFLKEHDYTTITTQNFNDWQKGSFVMPEKAVIIVFDDGWSSVKEIGFPILESLELKANVAVVSNYADGLSGSVYMNWSEIRELQDAGWGINSHSITHSSMLTLTESEFRNELNLSKEKIQENLNIIPESFVFPFHQSNVDYTSICGEYYDLCWTRGEKATIPRYNYKSLNGHDYGWINPYTGLKRVTISNSTTLEEFSSIFSRENDITSEWRMEEGLDTITEDSAGNNNAILTAGSSWVNE